MPTKHYSFCWVCDWEEFIWILMQTSKGKQQPTLSLCSQGLNSPIWATVFTQIKWADATRPVSIAEWLTALNEITAHRSCRMCSSLKCNVTQAWREVGWLFWRDSWILFPWASVVILGEGVCPGWGFPKGRPWAEDSSNCNLLGRWSQEARGGVKRWHQEERTANKGVLVSGLAPWAAGVQSCWGSSGDCGAFQSYHQLLLFTGQGSSYSVNSLAPLTCPRRQSLGWECPKHR